MTIAIRQYDPFTVESLIQGYRIPAATRADRAAAAQELSRRGLNACQIARRLEITDRSVDRLRLEHVEPLGPLPEWADDYEREWPKCRKGHELTPDNIRKSANGGVRCQMCYAAWFRGYYYRKMGRVAV